ncbi:ABC transporter permease [Agriterribacter sp.]|uniref:ABC transporter permease n=1 Tax=Agriterribacter sp. TaxID=2821509 RepID=UPI002C385DCF|nr:FtsX-like permease family protein [Agriterribacter sp.]HTN05498.1 FtsX-like permease family protein [Agriterribacter sp.]
MNFTLLLNIAKALLLARWRQTLVAAIGVTFGIAMFVTMQSFMTGLNKLLDGLILNRTPDVRLYHEIKPRNRQPVNESPLYKNNYNFISSPKSANARLEIYNSGSVMQSLSKDERVRGFAPRISTQVFFNNGNNDINGVINGIDVQKESLLYSFTDYVVNGKASDLKNVSNSIILGKGLAGRLQVNIGDVVSVTTAKGDQYSLKTVGFFQSGINEIDNVQSYASLSTTQKILGRPGNYITDINVKLKDLTIAPAVAKEYAQLYGTDAEDIQTANAQFETGSRVRSIISYSVGITLLIVAGFGIYNILNMMIYEKMDSIAILKATGFSGSDVKKIFLVISVGIGLFGGLLGLLLGYLLSKGINQIPFNTSALPTVKTYPINYNPLFYVIGILFSLITTYLAGLFPARKASKVDPVIIIRGK